ncbi:Flagellar basal-body rod protein FlgF [bacterium HR36]|uniref:Flagellar basal body rod protein FlgG n=1 Tax=uncultured Planctomycetota bacterium TaxID=120965 RepID=H5SIH6_9BACT|nr:flagellar basal body rod protein FlgG [uncultured Planctomycetota bacterium]GBD35741.1 Flagellar basal-body rod protein FlgF [bacterium HR36]
MLTGFYSAATALERAQHHHELVTFNLAHAAVPGYRQWMNSTGTFESTLAAIEATNAAERLGTRLRGVSIDISPGPIEYTGAPLDLAIRGPGFFVVEGPDGPLYTRAGTLSLNAARELVTPAGYPILGAGGRIALPENASTITVLSDGTIVANGQPIGQLRLVEISNPSLLETAGATLFRAPPAAVNEATQSSVLQGYREGSNVDMVAQLIQLITGMRHFEAAQRALHVLADSLQLQTRPNS